MAYNVTANVAQPYKVVYIDYKSIDWSNPSNTVKNAVDAGYNIVILAFYLAKGPADMAVAWEGLSASAKQDAVNYAHSKGAAVLVSAGGATDSPYDQMSGAAYGKAVADWAVANALDGVDFDLENFGQGFTAGSLSGTATVKWIADASNTARSVLGSGKLISHAPQGPYFGPIGNAGFWPGVSGGYSGVYAQASGAIDFLNVQFYNQGSSCYVSYDSLFTASNAGGACPSFPGTSVQEIASYGIPLNKIVVGKYLSGDASNGYVDPGTLGGYLRTAQNQLGWYAGVMCWVYEGGPSAIWISQVYP